MCAAADELAAETTHVDVLLTHDVGLMAGVEVMNALCCERRRRVGGRRVVRLLVTMNRELVHG
ncbi:hypothetical protein [Nocardia higoensis]|uniref:hypothetical protein n=1 Tax=Nocardia higoensis TaxID=228599 RepID=UPI0003097F9C|nr:hypothetical protein [Nocardia higoensis]